MLRDKSGLKLSEISMGCIPATNDAQKRHWHGPDADKGTGLAGVVVELSQTQRREYGNKECCVRHIRSDELHGCRINAFL